ncbi:uncharacterized protein ARMOST_22519 [Armillaria ostoyae]|uniref:F-box domain-containing protein n=1 Tax=Armillaria ostoyae TaxID=47428 RepID=A0A284SD23_ARMOS|nr:uncharacterized protein ARMOST_22519 [Armillaria ostoyae]
MSCRNCEFVPEPQLQNLNTKSSDSLVSQILRGQQPLLDSDHAFLNTEIVELERLQLLYDTQLEKVQLRRCAVLTALESRKSIYAPIRRLPHDILIEIFDSVSDSWWQEADENQSLRCHSLDISGPPWVMSLVVEAPFSKYAPEILQTYLEHTGEHHLNLQVSCRKMAKDDEILSLLVQSCQWWTNLSIDAGQLHMPHFESISHFPALQMIEIRIYDGYGHGYHSDMCLSAPQLWQASLRGHQIKLPPGITHLSGSITRPGDLHLLSKLPKLRRCHLWMRLVTREAPVVTVAQLTHLYVDHVDILNFLSAPLLSSLTISHILPRPFSAQESITRFLHRSRCHLESLSVGKEIFTSTTLSSLFTLEACSTVSRLKLELPPRMISSVVEALTFPSVLPNLHHLILCISQYSKDDRTAILRMACSCHDAGMLKLVEVQFQEEAYEYFCEEDTRALTRDDFAMRIEKWDPPCQDHLYLMKPGQ